MAARYVAALALGVFGTSSGAMQFESGDWAAARIGQTCYLYTVRSARDTSGTLIFAFQEDGYNASFTYEYDPWPGVTDAPWGPQDDVILSFDGNDVWLGEEMMSGLSPEGFYTASMTSGFVPEMIDGILNAERSVGVGFDRVELGEVWLYGKFSRYGFAESLQYAGGLCSFNPANLRSS